MSLKDGGMSDNESQATATRGAVKRAARHSIDDEVNVHSFSIISIPNLQSQKT